MDKPRRPGVVYTKAWVADLLLDLAGYTSDRDLAVGTILEPACGDGAVLEPIVTRLLASASKHSRTSEQLTDAVRAYDLDPDAVASAQRRLVTLMTEAGISDAESARLVRSWIRNEDFLLADNVPDVAFVVGNPPYIRIEDISPDQSAEYRQRWTTMQGRADIYIGFYEAGLSVLQPGGVLSFICADRWMKNQYGKTLRNKVVGEFSLEVVLELHESDVFESKVNAYPAVTLIRNHPYTSTAFARARPTFGQSAAQNFAEQYTSHGWETNAGFDVHVHTVKGSERSSWAIASADDLALVKDLEARFPTIEETGASIRGGMATGADAVYLAREADIENDRMIPIVGPTDLVEGRIAWTGRNLVNTWDADGLVDLDKFPRLRSYLHLNEQRLRKRHIAQNTELWWRTIDRPRLTEWAKPKLLIADIKNRIEPVLDTDGYVPMHSFYYVISDTWDLRVLGGLLLSDQVGRFLAAHSVVMASGAMRVSAQYLRMIRIPRPESLTKRQMDDLIDAFEVRDRQAATEVAADVFAANSD